ncbi:MAG: oleate hydratase [Pseudanabaena frigida]|uniref:Oleate hydratase n=1 Tax=Pseudanabaena frigida TaxID=945775 RepID=A0A2W4W583_9CYAN|nr:MAG: oleate hydratase [Pseudanabaena frigida]
MDKKSRAYLLGGGIGSLAAAAFMIRDGDISGENIFILEVKPLLGGSMDGTGNSIDGYSLRGGRMLTTDNYECTWDLFKSIPSLHTPDKSVYEETMEFNELHKSNSMARLVDRRRAKVPVSSMGFSMQNRQELLKLTQATETELAASCITDWLSPEFFETEFWFMWVTTFAFQPWHSAVEFKRYLHRFMLEFTRIETLAGVKRTIYNQYDSLILPLQSWLAAQNVRFELDCKVTDLVSTNSEGKVVVTGIHYQQRGESKAIAVKSGDLVFLQNGSMTDASSLGSMTIAPKKLTKEDCTSWSLWEKLAAENLDFGNPAVFNNCIAESVWESFTVTLKNSKFFDLIANFSGNQAGTGGLITFKDSNWLMSIVLAYQPHFINQPKDVQVFWGYGLLPDRVGNFVPKPMDECNGEEILRELCGHLRFDLDSLGTANCIPCRMPYITSMFMPRLSTDRPLPIPRSSKNLALISQFVEIPDDVVFTVEYSVRAAQMAVYEFLDIDRKIPPVTPHDKSLLVQFEALVKAFK